MSMGPARKRHPSILYGFMSVRVDQSRIRLFFSHGCKKTIARAAFSARRYALGSANKMHAPSPVPESGGRTEPPQRVNIYISAIAAPDTSRPRSGRWAFQAAVLKVRPRRAVKGPVAPPQKAPSPRSDLVRESSVHSRLPTTAVEHGRSTVL